MSGKPWVELDFVGQSSDAITIDPVSDAERRSAALTLCDRAAGADDARMLLEMLGLASYTRGKFTSYAFGRPSQPAPAREPRAPVVMTGGVPGGRAVPHRKAGKARAK